MHLEAMRAGDCVAYQVDLEPSGDARHGGLRRVGHAIVGPSSAWLWRPPRGAAPIELSFDLPDAWRVSAPWPAVDAESGAFRLSGTPASWRDQVAIGDFEETALAVRGGRLRVAMLGGLSDAGPELFLPWLRESAEAVAALYGRFPGSDTQVLLLPAAAAREPVPWGQVFRGGAPAVLFVVDDSRPLAEFRADWTAVHEFAHLLLPFVSRRDAWVSEGLASYYQNLLRARSGMLAPAEAWTKLWAGFERGRAATDPALTLAEATRDMYGPNLMRVYWAGAALALEADIELRKRTHDGRGLEAALDALARCCLGSEQAWTGDALFARLDELAGTEFLRATYTRYAESRRFPDVIGLYRELGIEPERDGLRFGGGERQVGLRSALDGSGNATDTTRRTAAAAQFHDLEQRVLQ